MQQLHLAGNDGGASPGASPRTRTHFPVQKFLQTPIRRADRISQMCACIWERRRPQAPCLRTSTSSPHGIAVTRGQSRPASLRQTRCRPGVEDPSQAGGRCHPRRANAREHLKHEHRSLRRCYFPPPIVDGLCDWACASPHSRSPAERLIDPARAGYSTPRLRTNDRPSSTSQRNHMPMAISFRGFEMRRRLTM